MNDKTHKGNCIENSSPGIQDSMLSIKSDWASVLGTICHEPSVLGLYPGAIISLL
jgi:hypothetical protein